MADLEGVQWWYAGMRRIAKALLTPLLPGRGEGRRILDAGCGTGWNLQDLAIFGDTYGVDLSPLAVITTRRRGGRVAQGNLLGCLTRPRASMW